jgi:hypothetical protein
MLTAPTLDKLRQLKLDAMAHAWSEQQQQAAMSGLAFDERFVLLVDAEWLAPDNKRVTRALNEAKVKLPRPRPAASAEPVPAAPTSQRGHGPTDQLALPSIETRHTLPATDQTCPAAGGTLTELRARRRTPRRSPWSSGASCSCGTGARSIAAAVTAAWRRRRGRCAWPPGPTRVGRPTLRNSPSRSPWGKYLDHRPLVRQVRILRREGRNIDAQTLWDQLATMADVLRPTYDAFGDYVRQARVVGADETWWRLMERAGTQRWWVWTLSREDAVV